MTSGGRHVTVSEVKTLQWDGSVNYFGYYCSLWKAEIVIFQLIHRRILCRVKLSMGRACIEHYRLLKRQCVFSHDELVCRMASLPTGTLDLTMSVMVYQDMISMVEEERKLRKQLLDSVSIFFYLKRHISYLKQQFYLMPYS